MKDNLMAARGGTYLLRDPETGQIMRTGRTKDLERRAKEHRRADETADLEFEVDRRTDVYAEQRGREQILHEKYRPPLNKIAPICSKNSRRQGYLQAARNMEDK
jgi:hypothetical protein